MKRILLGVFLAFSCLTLVGCATIINGTTQKIPVKTSPQGATAKNQDGVSCITPCSIELKRNQDHIITISKEGFETQSITCIHVLSRAVVGYIILPLGFISAAVDTANGSLYRLTPDSISLELKPVIAELEKPGLTHFLCVRHSGLSGIFPMALKKDSRRASLAGMTVFFVPHVVYTQTLIKVRATMGE